MNLLNIDDNIQVEIVSFKGGGEFLQNSGSWD